MSIHYGVIGTGPVGRVFAGLLRQAGHRVSVLAHRAQTQQILQRRPVVVMSTVGSSANSARTARRPSVASMGAIGQGSSATGLSGTSTA